MLSKQPTRLFHSGEDGRDFLQLFLGHDDLLGRVCGLVLSLVGLLQGFPGLVSVLFSRGFLLLEPSHRRVDLLRQRLGGSVQLFRQASVVTGTKKKIVW